MHSNWISVKPEGLYIKPAGVYVDPVKPVEKAIITHAHADHLGPVIRGFMPLQKHSQLWRVDSERISANSVSL